MTITGASNEIKTLWRKSSAVPLQLGGNFSKGTYVGSGALRFDEYTSLPLLQGRLETHGALGHIGVLRKVCEEERMDEALHIVQVMEGQGIPISQDILHRLLLGCIQSKDLAAGKRVHSLVVDSGLDTTAFFGNHLIRLFAVCGRLPEANNVFLNILRPSRYAWNAIIQAHAQLGEGKRALELYHEMDLAGAKPDRVTVLCILRACSSIGDVERGRLIHNQIICSELEADVFVGNTLIDMYGKCGSMDEARKVFDELPHRNVVSWGAIIAGYAQHGQGYYGLDLFEKLQQDGLKPGRVIFLGTLRACGHVKAIESGRLIHRLIIQSGLQQDRSIGNTLIDMYAKCANLADARTVFDKLQTRDVVSWSAIIAGYVQNGHELSALELFSRVQQEGIKPDKVIFLPILKACGSTGALEKGINIHDQIKHHGLELDETIGNTLVDMYAKCGSLEKARTVFDKMSNRYLVSWGAMIAGYAHHGLGIAALELYLEMQLEKIKPNKVIFLGVLKACSSVGAIRQGRLIHEQITINRLESDVVIGNAVIDMYIKSGSLEEANKVFRRMSTRDVVSWSAMIAGYAQYGNCKLAGQYLEDMQQEGLKADALIFTTLLTACSHAGVVEEGRLFFNSMRKDHGITPGVVHYNCMVDILSRTGHLREAEALLRSMPGAPDTVGWMSLLTGCKTYGHMELGRLCFVELMRLDVSYASAYMIISNIYADACMLEGVYKMQDSRMCTGVAKKPGRAWIEVDSKVYEFIVGEHSHQQSDETHTALKRLNRPMKEEGFVPKVEVVLDLGSHEIKEDDLCRNCERMFVDVEHTGVLDATTIRARSILNPYIENPYTIEAISMIQRRGIKTWGKNCIIH